MTVNLPGGGKVSTTNYETARDQLVQFITGDANATYKTASANVKKQTGLLMSIVTQCGPTMVKNGFISTLQKAGHEYTLTGGNMFASNAHKKPMTWTLGKTEDGSIKATVTLTDPVGFFFTAQGPMQLDATTSYEEITLDITIPADNLASLADQDWAAFDPAPYRSDRQRLLQPSLRRPGRLANPSTLQLFNLSTFQQGRQVPQPDPEGSEQRDPHRFPQRHHRHVRRHSSPGSAGTAPAL